MISEGSHSSMGTGVPKTGSARVGSAIRAGRVLVVTSVMFTFISYWRTAAIVLCDLASTTFYIGGIVESAVGKAAPWFILAVMLFSYAVRSVYIESCSMFVRGGVYRVVKEAMGGTLAKLSVSALMFDYILTGPISAVTAGQYIIGLVNETSERFHLHFMIDRGIGSMAIAAAITLYFWRANIRGIHESSDKALKIMGVTTVMAVLTILWCLVTIAVRSDHVHLPPMAPDLSLKVDYMGEPVIDSITGRQVDPLGFLGKTSIGAALRPGRIQWFSLFGVMGIVIAFGHSILAMSGEETLAQVYREVESPKLKNFKKAAFVVFIYSLLLTSLISFFAVMLIPDSVRMSKYADNLIGGLAMNVVGPAWMRLILNAFVVFTGFLILSGAVNTAIVGSNGVLNRVAEDGVMPDWFLRPHRKYGTTSRILNLVLGLQLFTILVSRGNVLTLGEAYAFGVVWSFVFKAMGMLVLRFKEPAKREYEVPLNITFGKYDFPLGITLIFAVLFAAAVMNLMTKEVATISGAVFTASFFAVFVGTEYARAHKLKQSGQAHPEHLEQFNQRISETLDVQSLELTKPYRKLVAIRSPRNLSMLEKCLTETDPDTTDVVVMTARVVPVLDNGETESITLADRELLTAVVNMAETIGKPVKPLIVPTNEPIYALARTAQTIGAEEIIMGASNKFEPHDQLDQIALYWSNVCGSKPSPLTIRVMGQGIDNRMDIAGGSRIPALGGRDLDSVRTLAELRSSWRGVEKLLLAYDGSSLSADFLDTVISFLDPTVHVTLVAIEEHESTDDESEPMEDVIRKGVERAHELGRRVDSLVMRGDAGPRLVQAALEGKHDAIFMSLRGEYRALDTMVLAATTRYVLQHAPCRVVLGFAPKSIQPQRGSLASTDGRESASVFDA